MRGAGGKNLIKCYNLSRITLKEILFSVTRFENFFLASLEWNTFTLYLFSLMQRGLQKRPLYL
jgi:hypothetical protein